MTLPRRRATPRRTTSPRCVRQRCNRRAEIADLCVPHAEVAADTAFSAYVRGRDRGCTAVGVLPSTACSGDLQAAHIVGRGNHATRYDPQNVHALCAAHHMRVDQSGREDAKYRWAIDRLGNDGYGELMIRASALVKRRTAVDDAYERWIRGGELCDV